MLIIKFIRWLYQTLNGVERPWQIALGFALGFAFGMPEFGLITLAGMLLALFINLHFGSAVFGLGVGLTAGVFVRPNMGRALGEWALEAGPHDFFKSLAVSDGWALFRLHETEMMGGLVLGLLLLAPLFFAAFYFIAWYRARFYERLSNSRIFKLLGSLALFRFLRWVFLGSRMV